MSNPTINLIKETYSKICQSETAIAKIYSADVGFLLAELELEKERYNRLYGFMVKEFLTEQCPFEETHPVGRG